MEGTSLGSHNSPGNANPPPSASSLMTLTSISHSPLSLPAYWLPPGARQLQQGGHSEQQQMSVALPDTETSSQNPHPPSVAGTRAIPLVQKRKQAHPRRASLGPHSQYACAMTRTQAAGRPHPRVPRQYVCVRNSEGGVPGAFRNLHLPTVHQQQQGTEQCGGGMWLERRASPRATHGHFPEPHSVPGILESHIGPDTERMCMPRRI